MVIDIIDISVLAEHESLASDIKAGELVRRIEECRVRRHKDPVQVGVRSASREIEMMCNYCRTLYTRMMTEDEMEEYL